jgi:hypothetical protein
MKVARPAVSSSWMSVRPASSSTNGSIAFVHVSPNPEIVLPLSVLSETVVPGFEKKPQLFETGGKVLVEVNRTIAKKGSIAAKLTLIACAPLAVGSFAPRRQLVNSVFHSITSNATSKKHCFSDCCTNSFIGRGCI